MARDNDRTYEIAVIGDSGSIAGFGGLGLRTFPVTIDTDPNSLLRGLITRDEFAIIYLTEQVAEQVQDLISELGDNYMPALITIPSASSTTEGSSLQHLQRMVMTAIGIDVIENLPEEDDEPEATPTGEASEEETEETDV